MIDNARNQKLMTKMQSRFARIRSTKPALDANAMAQHARFSADARCPSATEFPRQTQKTRRCGASPGF
jgi:hypothetical protein